MILTDTATRLDIKTARAVQETEKLCFSSPWSITSVENQLKFDHCIFACDKENDTLRGYVVGQYVLDECELFRIAVKPDTRKLGIASELMKAFIFECKEKNVKTIFLEVRKSNEPARGLYEKFGFQNIASRKNYYSNPDEDAVIYRLSL